MKTFIREIDWLPSESCGWGNGYVAVPKEHLLYGVDYNELYFIDVHGGLTYSDSYKDWMPKEFEGMWVFGFDCAHYQDTKENCPKEFVEAETERLKNMLSKVTKVTKQTETHCYTIEE